jgi:hypothetical protein
MRVRPLLMEPGFLVFREKPESKNPDHGPYGDRFAGFSRKTKTDMPHAGFFSMKKPDVASGFFIARFFQKSNLKIES